MAKYKLNEGRSIFFDPSQPKNKKVLQNQVVELENTANVRSALAHGYILPVEEKAETPKEEEVKEVKPKTTRKTTK